MQGPTPADLRIHCISHARLPSCIPVLPSWDLETRRRHSILSSLATLFLRSDINDDLRLRQLRLLRSTSQSSHLFVLRKGTRDPLLRMVASFMSPPAVVNITTNPVPCFQKGAFTEMAQPPSISYRLQSIFDTFEASPLTVQLASCLSSHILNHNLNQASTLQQCPTRGTSCNIDRSPQS